MNAGCGPNSSDWLAKYDPELRLLKIRQPSLALKLDGPSMESSVKWPRAGMIVCGMLFPQRPLVRGICESASSLSLPTPRASANESRTTATTPSQMAGTHGEYLQAKAIRLLCTPTTRDYKDTPGMAMERKDGTSREDQLPRQIYGIIQCEKGWKLSPEFLTDMMGFPKGWLSPLTKQPH